MTAMPCGFTADEIAGIRPRLLSYARGMCHSRADAEDLVQDALLRLWRIRDRIARDGRSIDGLMNVIVRGLFHNTLRPLRSRAPHVEIDDPDVAHVLPPVAPDAEARIERCELARWIASLPERERVVVSLILEDTPASEIARIMDIPAPAVRESLNAVRDHLVGEAAQ